MAAFHIHTLSTRKYSHTVLWAILLSILIVCATAFLARATHNFQAALIDKPDVAIYLLLPKEHLGNTTLLQQNKDDTQRAYLAQTDHGPELVILRKNSEWMVDSIEPLHEDSVTDTAAQASETPVLH